VMQQTSLDIAIREIAREHRVNPNRVFLDYAMHGGYRIAVLEGGTRSGKTYSTCEYLIDMMLEGHALGVVSIVRETTSSLFNSVERQFFDILIKKNAYNESKHNKTHHTYRHKDTLIEFFGADNPQKLRGSERDILFANEINGFKYYSYNELALRTRSRIIVDYNPTIQPTHFIYTEIVTRNDAILFRSNYLDNVANLTESQVREIESMRLTNPERYRTLGLGERGNVQGLIYTNWIIGDYVQSENEIYVMDLGYNDATTISRMSRAYSHEYQREVIYVENLMYERFLDVNQVLDRMKSLVPIDKNIVCDIAPQITKVFRNAGYRIIDAEKGKKVDAVKMLQSEIVIMDRKSKHLHSEQAAYTWKYDERTNRYLDELNDGNDHVLDAILYGYITKFANKGDAQVQKLKLYKPTLT